MEIPVLKTKQLQLEPLSLKHSKGMFGLWSTPKVTKYSGVVKDYHGNVIKMPAENPAQSDAIIDFWLKAADDAWGFRWAVMLQDQFIGTIGFNSLSNDYEIAFHLHPNYWGQGFMQEAGEAAIAWAQKNGASGVQAFVEPANKASISLSQKLGMMGTGKYAEGAQQYLLKF